MKIGFAAETENLLENAAQKLPAKGFAMIVANDAEATIGAASSTATILTADGGVTALPTMSKEALAAEIVAMIADLLDRGNTRRIVIYQGRSGRGRDSDRALTAGRAPWDCRLCGPLRRGGLALRCPHFGPARERLVGRRDTVAIVADHQAADHGPSR